jgi:hypothetical protein
MSKLRFALLWLKSFWPTQLPVGVTEFEQWYQNIVTLCRNRIPNNRSIRFALSGMVLHEGSSKGFVARLFGMHRKAPRYFVSAILKAASNEVAHAVFQSEKAAQQEEARLANAEANKDVVVPAPIAPEPTPVSFKSA